MVRHDTEILIIWLHQNIRATDVYLISFQFSTNNQKFIFDFGDEERQVMSAIAEFYPDPEVLVGKQICVCTNLEPRTFRGHESQGMILAVDNPEGGVIFIGPEEKSPAGAKLH